VGKGLGKQARGMNSFSRVTAVQRLERVCIPFKQCYNCDMQSQTYDVTWNRLVLCRVTRHYYTRLI